MHQFADSPIKTDCSGHDTSCPYNTLLISGRHKVCSYT